MLLPLIPLAVIVITSMLISIPWVRDLDESLFLWIHGVAGDLSGCPLTILTEFGSLYAMFALALVVWASGRRDLGKSLLVSISVSSVIGFAWKVLISRPRPHEVFPALADSSGLLWQSFPSGHTLVTFTVAGVLMARHHRYAPLMLVFAVAIGSSRVLVGAHFPFDVLAGALLGLVIGMGLGKSIGAEGLSEDSGLEADA